MKTISIFLSLLLMILQLLLFVFILFFLVQRSFYYQTKESVSINSNTKIDLISDDGIKIDFNMIDNNSKIDLIFILGVPLDRSEYEKYALEFSSRTKYNIFYYVMRGQCGNPGFTSEIGIFRDLKKISDFLKGRKTTKYGYSWSFGPALLCKLANLVDFAKIVLHNPFEKMENVVKQRTFGTLTLPFLVDKWDNKKAIRNLSCEIIVVASEFDKNIYPKNSEDLVKFNKKAKLVFAKGESHSTITLIGQNLEEYLYKYII
ncbi:Alpha/beta hydrolase domain-containing protein 17B [Nosema granulosis]|uniref:Alpha/beta hydrolase domain-containing protein 17B n=1 Tax=Nosema granulosis TaxID=83296 RepID=A0A9P6GX13_9MICR|nr:Alpha/beta hydrolase domain-containing protein 17B [Nosema granulosis]